MGSEADRPLGIGQWRIQEDGWVSIPTEEGDAASLHVRLQVDEDGRFVVTDLLVGADKVSADLLRAIQPARIEATFNLHFSGEGTPSHAMAKAVLSQGRSDDDVTLGELRRRTPVLTPDPGARIHLQRPDGTDPEGFYRRVAEAYRSATAASRRPAAILAEDAGVPVTTVHRWVREARRRGFLPPAQKGKAG